MQITSLPPIPDFLMLLAAAVAIVASFRALRVSPVLGYLVAGALIGENGLGLVHEIERTEAIGELGIVFLLFMIGLDLSWARLKAMRRQVLGVGSAQFLLTLGLFLGIGSALGANFEAALVIGAGLALSSTALVLQVLASRGELAGQTGRLSLAILLLQDLAVLPLLVLTPILASGDASMGHAITMALGRAVVGLGAIIIIGRLVLRPLFHAIARLNSEELFVATTLLVVFAISWLTEVAGLSMALGAFIAGMLVAETEFQHQVETDVKPYKALLMGLFFMTVGMKINVEFILANALEVVMGTLVMMALKAVVLFAILRGFGYTKRTSLHVGLLMAQGGEFAFILFGLADHLNLIQHALAQKLLLAIALSMAATPVLGALGALFERRSWRKALRLSPEMLAKEAQDLEGHVVVVGYGPMGQWIGRSLAQEKIPYIALETNPREVSLGRKRHEPVYFGDATRADILHAIGIRRALALVVTIHDRAEAERTLRSLRGTHPTIPIFMRASDQPHAAQMLGAGAHAAVPELEVTSMRLLAVLLTHLAYPEEEIHRMMQQVRG